MKKKKQSANRKDIIAILAYFLAAFVSLNILEGSVVYHILGAAFIIAGTYGVVAISKNKKFIF